MPIASVQNRYNIVERKDEDVLQACEGGGLAFIPWLPLNTGKVGKTSVVTDVAQAHDATPAQVALAWLLRHSSAILPIPGTSSVAHLEENVAAVGLQLTDDEMASLDHVGER